MALVVSDMGLPVSRELVLPRCGYACRCGLPAGYRAADACRGCGDLVPVRFCSTAAPDYRK